MGSRKWMNLFAGGGNGDADGREETCAHSKGGKEWDKMNKIPPTHVNYQASDGELVRSCSEAQEAHSAALRGPAGMGSSEGGRRSA